MSLLQDVLRPHTPAPSQADSVTAKLNNLNLSRASDDKQGDEDDSDEEMIGVVSLLSSQSTVRAIANRLCLCPFLGVSHHSGGSIDLNARNTPLSPLTRSIP